MGERNQQGPGRDRSEKGGREGAHPVERHGAGAEGLDAELIERERSIAKEKAAESGKPEAVQEKMVEGAIGKFAKENALMSQILVHDNKTPIEQVVAQAGKEAGKPIVLKDYVRFQLGEGIEKEESDFAAEVAAAVKG